MRKLILVAAFAFASVAAQAGESRNLVLAANDALAAAATSATAEAGPAAAAGAETARRPVSRKQASRRNAPHETDEQKARRIAAKYGVYW